MCDDLKSVMLCAIWYRLYNFKKREKHPRRSVQMAPNHVNPLSLIMLIIRVENTAKNTQHGSNMNYVKKFFVEYISGQI